LRHLGTEIGLALGNFDEISRLAKIAARLPSGITARLLEAEVIGGAEA